MKKILKANSYIIRRALPLLVAVLGYCYGYAQPRFHFVAPTATINASFPGHANPTTMGLPAGYDIVEITAANQAAFLSVAPPRIRYLYQQMQPGNVLRSRLDDEYAISNGNVRVNYYLVDDRTGISGASGDFTLKRFSRTGQDGRNHVWPTGNGFGLAAGGYAGRVRLGEYQLDVDQFMRVGAAYALQELVLHETFHSQLVGRWTKWNGYVYGRDNSHFVSEIMGDQEAALNEGFGTFFGYTVNTPGANALERFFTDAGRRYVLEGESVVAGEPALVGVTGRARRDVNGHAYFDYRWMDVPGVFNWYTEHNFTAFLYYFWRNANGNQDVSMDMIKTAARALWSYNDTLKRYPTYVVNRLALKMEDYNGNAGRADATRTSSMLPYALLDLVSHFSLTAAQYQADHNRTYPDRNPRAFTEYFNHRNAIQSLVQADLESNPIRFSEAVRKIKEYCMRPANIW